MSEDFDIENIRLLVLGSRESGKTLYRASTFKQLYQEDPNSQHGFFLTVAKDSEMSTEKKAGSLLDIYGEFAKLKVGQPYRSPGDISTTRTKFMINIPISHTENFPVCEINWMDYRGGAVRDLSEKREFLNSDVDELIKEVGSADCLFVILDGWEISKLLTQDNNQWEQGDFEKILFLASEYIQRMKKEKKDFVMHFILTKWDLLQRENRTLEEVRLQLLKNKNFEKLVHTAHRTLDGRNHSPFLIPVSIVGHDFFEAVATGEQGAYMVKTSVTKPYPLNMEIPLSLLLSSHISSMEKRCLTLTQRIKDAERQNLLKRFGDWINGNVNKYKEEKKLLSRYMAMRERMIKLNDLKDGNGHQCLKTTIDDFKENNNGCELISSKESV